MGSYTDLPRSHGGVEKHRVCERGSRLLHVDGNGGGKKPPPSKIITAVENHKRRITEDYGGLRRITEDYARNTG